MDLQFVSRWGKSDHLDYTSASRLLVTPLPCLLPLRDSVRRFHIAIEGAAGAGKTRLIRTLQGDAGGPEYQPTHGVAVHQVKLEVLYSGEVKPCLIYLWEYGTYYSRKYDYIQESVGPQDACIHVLSILDRDSFEELVERKDRPSQYSCVYLSKTDLSVQTNVFPAEIQKLRRDVFVEAKVMLLHLCGRLLELSC